MTRRGKFNAVKTVIDDIKFDSRGEAARYVVLKDRVERGFITALTCHQPYTLTVNGVKIAKYVADFVYEQDGQTVVEDFKSKATMTATFRLKAKLMKAIHDIDVKTVFEPGAE